MLLFNCFFFPYLHYHHRCIIFIRPVPFLLETLPYLSPNPSIYFPTTYLHIYLTYYFPLSRERKKKTPSMTFSHVPQAKTYLFTVSTIRIAAIITLFCIRRRQNHLLKRPRINPCLNRSGRCGRSTLDLYRLYLFLVSLLLPRTRSRRRRQSLISLQSPPALLTNAKPVLSWCLPVSSTNWLFFSQAQPNISPTNKTKSHSTSRRTKRQSPSQSPYLKSFLRSLESNPKPSSLRKNLISAMGSFTFKW